MVASKRDPGVIQLRVLGGLDARDADGKPLEALLAQPRRLCLLVALAIESMHGGCTRERLMALFWPEQTPDRAATNLRQAIAFLRRILGEGVIVNQGRHALVADPTCLRCDAVDALHALASTDAPSMTASAGELLAGVNLSDVGDAWDDWLGQQRRRFETEARPSRSPLLPSDPQAREAYLHGRFHWTRRPRESMKALNCLEEAVKRAPEFAPAHAALADVYNTLGSWESGALPSTDAFPKARDAARRALAIDPCCAAAHTALAYATAHYEWSWAAAEQQFQRALELDPGYAHAHHWHAHLLVAQGRFDAALAAGERALELQPLDIVINAHLAWHHWLDRNAEAAIEQAQRTAYLDETDHWAPFFRGMACAMCGRAEHAVDALRQACELSKGNVVMRAGLGYVYAVAGDRRRACNVLREFEAAADRQQRLAYEAAVIHAGLGDADAAFSRLRNAVASRSAWIAYLGVDPRLDPLRKDARYAQLESELGLQDTVNAHGLRRGEGR